jgi:4-amino-4-deoxy-L-arabinose transferase-like glycosyltransferase
VAARRWAWPPEAVLVAGALALAAANGWWIWTARRDLPYSIDEAGYLQRAIRDGQHLVHGGAAGLLAAIRTPDIQAPLVPVLGSLAYPLVHTDLLKLLISLQVFYVGTVVAGYALARVLLPRWWAVVTALLIGCTPGVLDQSRSFMFAEAATATFAAAIAAQIAAGNGRNRGLLLLAGALSGLTVLSRTMMVAFILVLWGVGALTVLLEAGDRRQRLLRFFLVPAVGSGVAAIWYSAQWRYVLEYLTSYGYGAHQAAYARAATLPLVGSLLVRLNNLTSEDFYLVAATLVVLGLFLGVWIGGGARIAQQARLRGLVVAPAGQLALVAIGALAALCSIANAGSGFQTC